MDTSSIIGTTAAISTIASSVLTFLTTRGVEAYLRLKKGQMEEQKYEDDKVSKSYEYLIGELTQRLSSLESHIERIQLKHESDLIEIQEKHNIEIKSMRDEHIECVKEQGVLKGRIEELQRTSNEVLKLWRHDEKNKEQIILLNKRFDEFLAQKGEENV